MGLCGPLLTPVTSASSVPAGQQCAVLKDLNAAQGLGGGVSTYWYPDGVLEHEKAHKDVWDSIITPMMAAFEASIEGQSVPFDCDVLSAQDAAAVKSETFTLQFQSRFDIASEQWNAVPESVPHQAAAAKYQQLIDQICAVHDCSACP
jgi:hypothetical protein